MANTRTQNAKFQDDRKPKKVLTWKEKLAKGERLTGFDEVKADADFNYRRRLREQQELRQFELRKAGQGYSEEDFNESDLSDEALRSEVSDSLVEDEGFDEGQDSDDLEQLSKKELVDTAKEESVDVKDNATKPELVEAIRKSREG